jgi:formylglycine-generating enzyme required for sulfatase activity
MAKKPTPSKRPPRKRTIHTDRDYFEHVEGDVNITTIETPPSSDSAALRNAYLNRLFESCSQVLLRGVDREATSQEPDACLHLDAIYTALLTQSVEHPEYQQIERQERQGRRLSAVAQLNQHKRLVFLGDPGSGKSTFVDFVTICLAGDQLNDPHTNCTLLTAPLPDEEGADEEERQPWDHAALLPVRIILRDFAAKGLPPAGDHAKAKHLWEFVVRNLEENLLGDYASHLLQYLREDGGLILLDGLDEVPEADKRRMQIKQVVEDFATTFPNCRILVTSRTYAYQQQEWRLSGFAEAVLAPFTKGQIRRFIDRWYSHSAEVRGKSIENALGQAELLKRAILTSDRLYSLAERPLLLTLMASLHYWRGGSLPEKREELYNDTVDLLLDWWERPKMIREKDGQILVVQESLTELLNVGKEPVRKALECVAFQAHTAQPDFVGTADIAEADLVQELMEVSQNRDLRPTRLIEYLSNRAGLLLPRGVKIYTFPHRTFQEYLTACYLTGQEEYPDNVAKLVRNDPNRWREVVLLAGAKAARGAVPMIWALAEALCYQEVDDADITSQDVWGALLAGQALVETANLQKISPRNQAKVERVRKWLVAILTEQAPSGNPFPTVERALAGNLLAHLGDPRPGVGLRQDGLPDIVWCDVPDGEFIMGSNDYDDEKPPHNVILSAYHISRYPVTNAQYRAFLEDGGYTEKWRQCWTQDGWKWKKKNEITEPDWAGGAFDLPNHPVVRVSWYEGVAFCKWLTLRLREKGELTGDREVRLPTEAEWEKAARGTGGRIYPWRDEEITPELANYSDTGLGVTSAVGCFPRGKSPYGCEDMAGNVWEWCVDQCDFDSKALTIVTDTYKDGLVDPVSTSGSGRVDRGGCWRYYAGLCRAARRLGSTPDARSFSVGFRLLRTPS